VPTYQYSCTDCGHFFEAVQSFSDDSLTVCPECEGRLRKVFNAVGVVFKGSGFYRNDSRTDARSQKDGTKDGQKESVKSTSSNESGSTNGSGSTKTSGETKKTSDSSTSTSSTTPSPAA
jgi:putative FmdB family regulatory protein